MVPQSISTPIKQKVGLSRSSLFRLLRLGLMFSVAGVAGIQVWKNYTKIQSRQAVINAEIINVRNPIGGNLQLQNIEPGQWLKAGTVIGKVDNLLQASELEVKQQELQSKIELNKQQLLSTEAQIFDRRKLLNQFSAEVQKQKQLEAALAQQQVQEAKSQLDQNKIAAQTAKEEANRNMQLARAGAIAKLAATQVVSRAKVATAAVNSAQARYQQAQQRYQATQAGLQIDSSRTLSYPEIRVRELQTEITDLQRQVRDLQVEAQTNKVEFFKMNQQLKLNKSAVITTPATGTVWSIDAKKGEYIAPTTPIIKILNCQNRWVDAFFAESTHKNLAPGMPVKVNFSDLKNQTFTGKIEAMRSGTGRVTTGKDVAVPPPDNTRRQIAVRVQVDWPQTPNSGQFCDVGRSAEVIIPKN